MSKLWICDWPNGDVSVVYAYDKVVDMEFCGRRLAPAVHAPETVALKDVKTFFLRDRHFFKPISIIAAKMAGSRTSGIKP